MRVIGKEGERETETAVLLHEHDIPTQPFSGKVMRCLPREGAAWRVTPELLAEQSSGGTQRRDVRDNPCVCR